MFRLFLAEKEGGGSSGSNVCTLRRIALFMRLSGDKMIVKIS